MIRYVENETFNTLSIVSFTISWHKLPKQNELIGLIFVVISFRDSIGWHHMENKHSL